jgi:hypothetical protein
MNEQWWKVFRVFSWPQFEQNRFSTTYLQFKQVLSFLSTLYRKRLIGFMELGITIAKKHVAINLPHVQ